jgi:hypothetical protein
MMPPLQSASLAVEAALAEIIPRGLALAPNGEALAALPLADTF